MYPRKDTPSLLVDISRVTEFNQISVLEDKVTFGASVPLSTVISTLEAQQSHSITYQPIAEHLGKIASNLVRNVRFHHVKI